MSETPVLRDLFELLRRRGDLDVEQRAEVVVAYSIAARAHAGERRKSGDPYITHPVAVAEIAAGFPHPLTLVVAALLHDVVDSGVPTSSLVGAVHPDVLAVVDAHNALDRTGRIDLHRGVPPSRPGALPAEQVTAMAIALKVADRLHNARTWQYVPLQRARTKASETLEVIAPAAAAAGLTAARDELLTLSHATLGRRSLTAQRFSHSLLHRALDRLPEDLRHRYAEEWAADLAVLTRGRDRVVFSLGLQYSARKLTRSRR